MDEPQSTPPEPVLEDGKAYGTKDSHGTDIIVQTKTTYLNLGTTMETMRRMLGAQDKRIKELLGQNSDLQVVKADLTERLETLRANHRKIIAAKVEEQLKDIDSDYGIRTIEGHR